MKTKASRLSTILNFDTCAEIVASCPQDLVAILCPNYSIHVASKYEDGQELAWDLDELSEILGHCVFVNDYDDLVVDPHGVISE